MTYICPAQKQNIAGSCPGLWCRLNKRCWLTDAMIAAIRRWISQ